MNNLAEDQKKKSEQLVADVKDLAKDVDSVIIKNKESIIRNLLSVAENRDSVELLLQINQQKIEIAKLRLKNLKTQHIK